MSEHIQPASDHRDAGPTHSPVEHQRTPGVAHESEAFDFWLIVWVGAGLAATCLVIQIALWGLLGGFERRHTVPPESVSALAKEDADRPLGQRVDNVPGPHLEGVERESSLLELLTENGEKHRFFTSVDLHVRIGTNEKARLFELREGQRVTLSYYMPGGTRGGLGVVTSVRSPPVQAEQKKPQPELPDVARTLNGKILRIEPRSIADARAWAEVQMARTGWIDRQKEIVHVPIDKAMEEVLRSKELGSPKQSRERKRPENAGGKR